MQPYRQARVHDPEQCPSCGPKAPGHQLCQHDDCGELAESQHRRHATAAEYAALPERLVPIDGVCHMAVFTCGDHELEPVCGPADHADPPAPEPGEVTCPRCDASPGVPCAKADGRARRTFHKARAPQVQAVPATVCQHVHREDCAGLGACVCSPDDPVPDRPRRIVAPAPPAAPPAMHLPTAGPIAAYLAEHGIDVARLVELTPRPLADGTLELHALMVVVDAHGNWEFDEHGQPRTVTVTVPFAPLNPPPAPLGPVL